MICQLYSHLNGVLEVILNFLRDGDIELPEERDEKTEERLELILREAEVLN